MSVEVLVMKKNGAMPEHITFEMTNSFAKLTPGKQLAQLRKYYETDTLKIISIINVKETAKKYAIPVETFMEYAMEVG